MRAHVAGFVAVATLSLAALGSAPAHARGTFLIVEGQLGFAGGGAFPESSGGLGSKLTLGAGGKLVGFPTRFYAIGTMTWSSYGQTLAGYGGPSEIDRQWLAFSGGLRTLTPIWGHLRLLLDASLGTAVVTTRAILHGGAEVLEGRTRTLVTELGAGLQYRMSRGLSVGLRADLAIPTRLPRFDFLAEALGASSDRSGAVNTSVLGTVTLHL